MTMKAPDPRDLVAIALASAQELARAHRAAIEQLEAARAALFAVPYLSLQREAPNPEHADSYQQTADVLRRRAARQPAPEQAATLARANWYAQRAEAKRTGKIMPRELRTPGERLGFVNALRHALLLVLEAAEQLELDDVARFVHYLDNGEGQPLHTAADAPELAMAEVQALLERVPAVLERLGLGETDDGARGFFECAQPLTFGDESPTDRPDPPEPGADVAPSSNPDA